jgi:glycosyltransferase involved in cell wall biosynthesis
MKKILIVNNNLDMGGIQKSLVNLLREIKNDYDVTLLLFSKSGSLLSELPKEIKVITPRKVYSILGLPRQELKKHPLLFILKVFMMMYTSLFSRRSAMKLLGLFQKKITGYDTVISYSHLTNDKCFDNGCGDFVLDRASCGKKVCLIHCDYLQSVYMTERNSREYSEFDEIACCSDSVKDRFIQGSSMDSAKVHTLRNFFDFSIEKSAKIEPYSYDKNYINLLSVARLSEEKGIDRAINAIRNSKRTDIRYYIVGDGPQKPLLMKLVLKYNLEEQIFFLGEQQNPYRYMLNADYLFVPSLHEAAPMVFDEANLLGLKILSTNTTSAIEMVGEGGVICDNSIEGIELALSRLTKGVGEKPFTKTNQLQKQQFRDIVC